MSTPLSEQQLQTLKQNFQAADKDGSGKIDKQELGALFSQLYGSSEPQVIEQMVEAAFANCDSDDDGYISFDEYLKLVVLP